MRSVLEIFWEFLIALTGAIGLAALIVGGTVVGLGCALYGCSSAWRRWRRRGTDRTREEEG